MVLLTGRASMQLADYAAWRCCEFIAWKCDLVGGGKETANFLHRGDKCRKEEALSVGLRRIHEAERGTGVT
jgi:hypothetical protein